MVRVLSNDRISLLIYNKTNLFQRKNLNRMKEMEILYIKNFQQ